LDGFPFTSRFHVPHRVTDFDRNHFSGFTPFPFRSTAFSPFASRTAYRFDLSPKIPKTAVLCGLFVLFASYRPAMPSVSRYPPPSFAFGFGQTHPILTLFLTTGPQNLEVRSDLRVRSRSIPLNKRALWTPACPRQSGFREAPSILLSCGGFLFSLLNFPGRVVVILDICFVFSSGVIWLVPFFLEPTPVFDSEDRVLDPGLPLESFMTK